MALLLKENPGLIDGSNAMEEIGIPEMDAAVLMSLFEESHCEEYYNEEQINSFMESLEAEIRMANRGSCSIEGVIERNGSSAWSEMEMVPSSPSDDMNWCVDDHFEEISMDELVQFGNDFALNCYEIQSENGFSANLWQETHDTATYN
ncbi:Detected protein of unknown function [Hibiscus syriacus]|uniref:Uncharacterized protein n=1 Tax=Hibiscus syriacus TaxID=106335 RepID=A0A6A3AKP8_HIBSY|nr:Detected protein of unknown function [Hibiscus syriacus]